MFVLLPTFQAPLDQVDTILEEHRGWLDEHCSAGRFLVFGRRVPRDGGFILADGGANLTPAGGYSEWSGGANWGGQAKNDAVLTAESSPFS